MMVSRLKNLVHRARRQEKGQTFILVLILMLLGGLIIAPLLAFMGTGLQTGRVFETKTSELYAADSGIEDGIWQIKYDELQSITTPGPYSSYDYFTQWDFVLDEQVNSEDVTGTIENVWIPKGLTKPSEAQAEAIIEGIDENPPKVMINGSVTDAGDYRIKITYNKEQEDVFQYGDELVIEEIGIWLPAGFEYVEDSSNLEADPYAGYYSVPLVSPHAGGQAVVWSFSSLPLASFPGVQPSDAPMVTDITFEFTARRSNRNLEAMSWVDANFNLYGGKTYTWDADTKVYRITSEAGDTELEAHTVKSELRELGGAISGDYFAFGNTLLTPTGSPSYRDRLYEESSSNVVSGDIPEAATIDAAYLYWSGWIDWHGYEPSAGGETTLFYDNCGNLNNGNWDYDNNAWHESGSYTAFYVYSTPYGDEILTLHSSLALAAYADKAVTISWRNWTYNNYQEPEDCFQYAFYSDSGGWGDWNTTYCGNFGTSPLEFSTLIPVEYLTNSFKVRFRADGFEGDSEYCYINDITVTVSDAIFSDDCSDFSAPQVGWNNGSDWQIDSGTFEGHHVYNGDRYLTMVDSIDLSSYAGQTLSVSWEQSIYHYYYVDYNDCLKFAFSGDGGSSWSSNNTAFCGNNPVSSFSYTIPEAYLTDDFRLRFYLEEFSGSNEYVYIDNIAIAEGGGSLEYPDDPTIANLTTLVEETARVNTVMFNDTQITADGWHVLENENPPGYDMFDGQWSYSCFYDASDLVEQWIEDEDLEPNAMGTYTVGHVVAVNEEDPGFSFDLYPSGETGYPLATPSPPSPASRYQAAYAGWSLILIYSSAETKGHQLYLYDDFIYAWHVDPDFDNNGSPGGSIGGFLVPDPVSGETIAAQVTAFVGEGDSGITGDYMKINGSNLSNGASPVGNVWNSASPGVSIPGVDIDTFDVTWTSGILAPGDTQADINLPTNDDGIMVVYIIISFRSDTVSGGAISYLIVD